MTALGFHFVSMIILSHDALKKNNTFRAPESFYASHDWRHAV